MKRDRLSRRVLLAGAGSAAALSWAGCVRAAPSPSAPSTPPLVVPPQTALAWVKLPTEPYKGKQDDLHFVTPQLGLYVNGAGRIFKTTDGGQTWAKKIEQTGTFFRCVGMVDERLAFAGNIGPDYYPGVTDAQPLYRSEDGGESWAPVPVEGVKGLCAIDIVRDRFIHQGVLEERTVIHAAGRVGGPAVLMRSLDGGRTWNTKDLSSVCAMVLDVHFFDANEGVLCAATDRNVETSNALVLMTRDGGESWTPVYRSARPFEITWKCSFPTRQTGYVTVQSYNPDKAVTERVVAKTSDGGATWTELPLVSDFAVREFGVAFLTPELGWVGTLDGGYETRDGGRRWTHVPMGRAVNKIRLLRQGRGFVGYAIGVDVHKLEYAPV